MNYVHRPTINLPCPFIILQGSPGDGMANTIDSMPMLLQSSPTQPLPPSTATRTSTSATTITIAEEFENVQDHISAITASGGRFNNNMSTPKSSRRLQKQHTTATATQGRLRSNSQTEGGIHLPLPTSPIMRNAAHSFMSSPSLLGRATATATAENHSRCGRRWRSASVPTEAAAVINPMPVFGNDHDGDDNIGSGQSSVFSLKSRSKFDRSIVGMTYDSDNDDHSDDNDNEESIVIASEASPKTPEEVQAIQKWEQECKQHELSLLNESNDNVKLLIQRRKQSRDRTRLNAEASDSLSEERLDARNRALRLASTRSLSPIGTATSASSSSASSSSSPTLTASKVTIKENEEEEAKEEEDPLQSALYALELANNHRSWYQKDGRLVVLKSLPHVSSQGSVVSRPIKLTQGRIASQTDVLTLSPGCQVMAESLYILDSKTLRQVYPQEQKQAGDDVLSTTSPQLTFLKISSPTTGYILSSLHSYPILLPGPFTSYIDSNQWLWRVTCQPDGAYIRQGLELNSQHIGTLPFGTVCQVTKKVVNDMGLNRLNVEACLNNDDITESPDENDDDDEKQSRSNVANVNDGEGSTLTKKYSGYISEFLNPLSGQRGNVVEPIPFPIPAIYKVINSRGCIIRSGVELSTSQIGLAPAGTLLSIVGRAFSDHPGHNCIERLKLAGGGGWISITLNKHPPHNEALVEMVGIDDSFDPNDPAKFHFDSMRKVLKELHANNNKNDNGSNGNATGSRACEKKALYRRRSSYTTTLSEIGDDDDVEDDIEQSESALADNTSTAVPTLFRSGVVGGLLDGGTTSSVPTNVMDAIRESSSQVDNHHDRSANQNRCLICLTDERTSTIVHGEVCTFKIFHKCTFD